jgi:hypothetical protein
VVIGALSAVAFGNLAAAGLGDEDVRLLVEAIAADLRAEDVRLVGVLASELLVGLSNVAATDRIL